MTRINAQKARASIALTLHSIADDRLDVEASAELLDPAHRGAAALYLAAYESRLQSRVDAGENRGRVLSHDYVALEWQGPFRFDAQARVVERRALPLPPGTIGVNSGVVGFVQNRRTGEVLQALMRPACPGL